MLSMIEHNCKNRIITSIYNDTEDTRESYTGYIDGYDENFVVISHISTHGYYDGYVVIPVDSIFQLKDRGRYEEKVEQLYEKRGQKHQSVQISEQGVLPSMLNFAMEQGYIVEAELQDNYNTGIIEAFDEETITLREITDYGEADSAFCIRLEKILSFAIDSMDGQDILLLRKE